MAEITLSSNCSTEKRVREQREESTYRSQVFPARGSNSWTQEDWKSSTKKGHAWAARCDTVKREGEKKKLETATVVIFGFPSGSNGGGERGRVQSYWFNCPWLTLFQVRVGKDRPPTVSDGRTSGTCLGGGA